MSASTAETSSPVAAAPFPSDVAAPPLQCGAAAHGRRVRRGTQGRRVRAAQGPDHRRAQITAMSLGSKTLPWISATRAWEAGNMYEGTDARASTFALHASTQEVQKQKRTFTSTVGRIEDMH